LQKDESRLRVIHISSSFAKGGLERFPVRLAKAQACLGVKTSVLTHKEAYVYQYARRLGVDVFGAESRAQMISWLWRQRKHDGPTVLQVNANKDLPMAVLAKRFFAKDKVRLTYRRGTRAMKPKTDPYHRLLFREVDLFIVVSRFIHDNTLQVYKVPESRVLCIHNGVEPDFFGTKSGGKASLRQELGIPEEAFVFGQVANYGTGKCPDVFLKGAERFLLQQAQALPVFFLLAGEGPQDYRRELDRLAKDLKVSPYVRFLDYQEDLRRLYDAIDCVVLCSRAEPFGNVLLEAMSLKKPIIAARSGGNPEIVEEGVTGLLFDPFDVEALAEAMQRLLEGEGLAQRFGEAGFRRYLEHFRMDSCTRSYLEAYERLFQKEPYP
jgi:glycosyltransferase involved in cell wall biosynthesis